VRGGIRITLTLILSPQGRRDFINKKPLAVGARGHPARCHPTSRYNRDLFQVQSRFRRDDTLGSDNGALSVKTYSSLFCRFISVYTASLHRDFRFAAPESIQPLRLAPAHTLPGSLSLAGSILVSFLAFIYSIIESINLKQTLCQAMPAFTPASGVSHGWFPSARPDIWSGCAPESPSVVPVRRR